MCVKVEELKSRLKDAKYCGSIVIAKVAENIKIIFFLEYRTPDTPSVYSIVLLFRLV